MMDFSNSETIALWSIGSLVVGLFARQIIGLVHDTLTTWKDEISGGYFHD